MSNPDILYHVTRTASVERIRKQGLRPMQTSNWIHAGTGERYGRGEIYAFESPKDAKRWAAKMDWSVNKTMGSGKVSILSFRTDIRRWATDPADPLQQAMCEGRWLRYMGGVAAEDILQAEPFTEAMAKELVA